MPTPAAGSVLRAARITPSGTWAAAYGSRRGARDASARPEDSSAWNCSTPAARRGACGPRRSSRSGPAEPGPALRRGFLVAVPVGAGAPPRVRARRPTKGAIGDRGAARRLPGAGRAGAAAGRLAGGGRTADRHRRRARRPHRLIAGRSAIPTMALVGAAAGYCFAVSLRLSIAGLSVALSLLIAQGLPLDLADALPALLLATAGGLLQAALLALRLGGGRPRPRREGRAAGAAGRAVVALRANFSLRSVSFRHALRFGAALAAGVAAYWLLGMERARLLDPADDPLRPAPRAGRDLPPPGPAGGRHRARPASSPRARRVAARRRARDRARPDDRDRLRLRPAHGPVRALHRRDHDLRGAARRLDRRDRIPCSGPARPRHRAGHRRSPAPPSCSGPIRRAT